MGRLGWGLQHDKTLLQGGHQYVVDGLSRAAIHRDCLVGRRFGRGAVPLRSMDSPLQGGGMGLKDFVIGAAVAARRHGVVVPESS